jgi:DNA-binding LacI/PurR family transcriptional regulator
MTQHSSSVTIYDVAQQAGVSVATVSRYINRSAPVSPEVAIRLEKVMAELRYIPRAAARHLASKKTRAVGLLLNNLHNDFFVPLLNGIESIVREKGYNLIVATHHAGDYLQLPIGPHNTDGMLVFSDGLPDDDLAALHMGGFPMVLVHRLPPPDVLIPSVTVENVAIIKSLMEHLIKVHGKRRILFLRGLLDQEDAILREEAYRCTLQENGISVDEDLIINGDFERDIAYQAMNRFLGQEKKVAFDAVFTGDDDAAIGVLKSLHEHRIRIPEDVAVIGFDDLGFAPFLNPPLTTVRAPTAKVGEMATERLFEILENQPSSEITILPTEIIFRRSCGCES